MTTHEVEKLLGITKQALLYYEKENLIHPQRDINNYRNYSENDVDIIELILLLRSMDISIDEVKLVLNNELSIRKCLETKQNSLKSSKEKLDKLNNRINDYMKRVKINICDNINCDTYSNNYTNLYIKENSIFFNKNIINVKDIKYIDISICCAKGEDGLYYSLYNLYFVCLDICSIQDTYYLELMNNSMVLYLFTTLQNLNIPCNDPMDIINAYQTYTDPITLYNHFNRNFRNWSKQYHLQIDGIHTVLINDYIKPLQQMKQKEVPSIKEQLTELKNIYIHLLNNTYVRIFKKTKK